MKGEGSVTKYGYATYRDAETWDNIDGDTREEAALNVFEELGDEELELVYICEVKPIDKLSLLEPDVERLLEDADEHAYEEAPWWDDSVFASSTEARARLSLLLQEAFARWLEEHPGPSIWQAVNVTEHTREDVAAGYGHGV